MYVEKNSLAFIFGVEKFLYGPVNSQDRFPTAGTLHTILRYKLYHITYHMLHMPFTLKYFFRLKQKRRKQNRKRNQLVLLSPMKTKTMKKLFMNQKKNRNIYPRQNQSQF